MDRIQQKNVRHARRKLGIRKRVFGTPQRPRLTVYRSLKYVYAQIVDDLSGRTLVAASSIKTEAGGNKQAAAAVGKTLAEKAKAAGIAHVAFDRNGFRYHGRIKALADAAREAGLSF
jgi:large subunit ribosomal protein L18